MLRLSFKRTTLNNSKNEQRGVIAAEVEDKNTEKKYLRKFEEKKN